MNYKRFIAYTLPLALLVIPFVVGAQNVKDYLLVSDLPFIRDLGEKAGLSGYLTAIFRLGIGLAVVIAVFMIVFNGIQYMVSDVVGQKATAKKGIENAIWGLVLVLASVLILNTINPNIVKFELIQSLERAADSVTAPAGGGSGTTTPQTPGQACANCQAVPSSLPIKAVGQACKPNLGACFVEQSFGRKLVDLNNSLKNVHDISWQITEAYPPTVTHRNPCHNNGTCVDATTSHNASSIKTFIEESSAKGMTACYEIPESTGAQDTYNELKERGVPESNMVILQGIIGRHFSLYSYRTACKR